MPDAHPPSHDAPCRAARNVKMAYLACERCACVQRVARAPRSAPASPPVRRGLRSGARSGGRCGAGRPGAWPGGGGARWPVHQQQHGHVNERMARSRCRAYLHLVTSITPPRVSVCTAQGSEHACSTLVRCMPVACVLLVLLPGRARGCVLTVREHADARGRAGRARPSASALCRLRRLASRPRAVSVSARVGRSWPCALSRRGCPGLAVLRARPGAPASRLARVSVCVALWRVRLRVRLRARPRASWLVACPGRPTRVTNSTLPTHHRRAYLWVPALEIAADDPTIRSSRHTRRAVASVPVPSRRSGDKQLTRTGTHKYRWDAAITAAPAASRGMASDPPG